MISLVSVFDKKLWMWMIYSSNHMLFARNKNIVNEQENDVNNYFRYIELIVQKDIAGLWHLNGGVEEHDGDRVVSALSTSRHIP